MSKIAPDEHLDRTLAKIFAEAAVSETETDEIADSPALWRAVKREIRSGAKDSSKIWPPVKPLKLWPWVGVPSFAAVLLIAVILASGTFRVPKDAETELAVSDVPASPAAGNPHLPISAVVETESPTRPGSATPMAQIARRRVQRTLPPLAPAPAAAVAERRPRKSAEPIKSDFIALSLAPRPETGQIVKLRVPSTLMVSLGLVESVRKPSAMVDAEVLMGDDGLTHSIRFIR